MIDTDFVSQNPVFVDFETVSFADLREIGGRAYANHPSTRVLCCAVVDGDDRSMWVPNWVLVDLPLEVHGFEVTRGAGPVVPKTAVLCGHNSLEFDAHVWNRFVGTEHGWRDTLPLCRAAALPAGLDRACSQLFHEGKNPKGKVLEVLSRAYLRAGQIQYPVGTRGAWEMLLEYCADDCLLLRKLHDAVIDYAEPAVLQANQRVNDRGFPIDEALCARLALLQDELARKKSEEICEVTEGDLALGSATSVQKVKAWLERGGVTLPTRNGKPSLIRADLKRLFEDPESFCGNEDDDLSPDLVARVLRLRQEVARNTIAKAMRMLSVVDTDGYARGQFAYYAAHSGRWGGRMIQPHNFPVGIGGVDHGLATRDATLEAIEADATRLKCQVGDVLATLLRPCVAGKKPLSIGDYGQVEARGVCWVSDERGALAFFADPSRDYYTHYVAPLIYGATATIGEKERWFAKQTGLGAGYSMSKRKMRSMMVANGVDFVSAGVSPEGIIDAYRRGHPSVVSGWTAFGEAAMSAMRGEPKTVCKTAFSFDGTNLVAMLPSGRPLVYRDARIEMQVPMWALMYGRPMDPQPTIAYTHPRGYAGTLYGGRICENVVQALCRDLLADALVRAEDAGFEPVLHVHDELVCQNCDAEQLALLMSEAPSWAVGFPVMVEAFSADRYWKKAPKGAKHFKALNGRIV